MKTCSRCKRDLPVEAFSRGKGSDGLQWWCKQCFKARYADTADHHRQQVKDNKARRRELLRRQVWDYLATHPCVDCGETDPIVLEFDHRDPADRAASISAMIGRIYYWKAVLVEIEKCDVRCANCHRRRTADQFGFWKTLDRASITA